MRPLLATLVCCAACTATSDQPSTLGQRRTPDSSDVLPFGRPDSTADIAAPRLSILGVTIGMPDHAVRRELGPPTTWTVPQAVDLRDTVFVWRYPGIQVSFDRNRVYDLRCKALRCETAEGVRTGSTYADVLRTYGPGFRGYSRSNEVLIYYSRPTKCRMVFSFSDHRVSSVDLECDWPPAARPE